MQGNAAMQAFSIPAIPVLAINESDCAGERRLTDVSFLVAAIGALAISVLVATQALANGSMAALYKGTNYNGLVCGIDPHVRNLPFLYYPLNPQVSYHSLLMQDAKCVARCPTEEDVKTGGTTSVSRRDFETDPSKTSSLVLEFKLYSPVYATTLVANAYCIPKDPDLQRQILQQLSASRSQTSFAFGGFASAWPCLTGYILLGVAASIAYVLLLRWCVRVMVLFTELYLVTSLILGGTYVANYGIDPVDSTIGRLFSENYNGAVVVGLALIASGVIVGVSYLCSFRSLKATTKSLECAADPIFDTTTIFISPAIQAAVGLLWVWLWLVVFLKLAGWREIKSEMVASALDANGGSAITPLHRTVMAPGGASFSLIWWVFVLFWVLEFLMAASHFVLSYTGAVWYFSPPEGSDERDIGWCPTLVASSIGILNHAGSFSLAALIMGVSRPIRILFSWASYRSINSRNPLTGILSRSLRFLVLPCRAIVDNFMPSLFIEMAVSSSNFMDSVKITSQRLSSPTVAARLSGYPVVATWTATACISLSMGLACLSTLRSSSTYASSASPRFVSSPLLIAMATAVFTAYIVSHFHAVWDVMAEALLYCFILESAGPNGHIDENPLSKLHPPPQLRDLMIDVLEERDFF